MKHLATAFAIVTLLYGCGQKSDETDQQSLAERHPAPLAESEAEGKDSASQPSPPEDALSTADTSSEQKAFYRLSNQMVERMWQLFPTWAISNGYYQVANLLEVPDKAYRRKVRAFARNYLNEFGKFNQKRLDDNARTDLALINNFLNSTVWEITDFKSFEWNPAEYNVSHGFALILNTDYAPLDERLRTFSERLKLVPAYYIAAEESIQKPASPQLILAIQQNEGAQSVFGEDLMDKVSASGLSEEEKKQFAKRVKNAREAIEEYVTFLQTMHAKLEKEDAFRSFRIGEKLYEQKFKFDIQISMSGEQLYQRALEEKNHLHEKMSELADKLWPKYFEGEEPPAAPLKKISAVLEKLSEHHATKATFKAEVEKQIPELEAFVIEHDLLTLDPDKPLVVRTTPPYMRGFSVASINAPGPYDSGANTYYNVMAIESMADDAAESLLREYNSYLMQILNIHEAIPGHYTQLVYANKSPSLIKNILGNGAMIEGWAVYTERMMLEAGYGDFEPELWMMYYKWNLRTVVNTILDYSIQVKDMSEQEALDLMMKQAFQQKAEAMGKWRRATLSQVQLTSYFAGYMAIMNLREEMKQRLGDKFNLKAFNEKFLSYGNAPVPVIRELMLSELPSSGQPASH
ncbi:DUF885 domain-containing protein [uncultured Microbulbifer sp.]|uniref:DUF885 domain-containing protein n=1 Tax=uncultured Microbulbifer sp. TaxID=348147 RepID=UPI0025DDE920|nr:DUF885 domain-containing protein [uncultured Microbulbifer sp.]